MSHVQAKRRHCISESWSLQVAVDPYCGCWEPTAAMADRLTRQTPFSSQSYSLSTLIWELDVLPRGAVSCLTF